MSQSTTDDATGDCCRHCEKAEETAMRIAFVSGQLGGLQTSVDLLRDELHVGFVRQAEFSPVKSLVYGVVGLVLSGFVGILVAVAAGKLGH